MIEQLVGLYLIVGSIIGFVQFFDDLNAKKVLLMLFCGPIVWFFLFITLIFRLGLWISDKLGD